MSVGTAIDLSLRRERLAYSRLAWAFAISISVHLLCAGIYEGGRKFGVWNSVHWPAWLQKKPTPAQIAEAQKKILQQEQEAPLMFVETTPAQAVSEAPKNAKYYSDKNTKAASRNADEDSTTPKIEGTQTEVAKTENAAREKYSPLQPYRPPERPAPPSEESKPKPTQPAGDLSIAKPAEELRKTEGNAEQERPRTLAEARARMQNQRIPGEQMKQEGGVRRHLDFSSLDAKETPFGGYDAAFTEAVANRWYDLLDERNYGANGRGKVVLQFKMHYDGHITDMRIVDNSAGDVLGLLCEKAVLDPAPFERWPSDMRRMLGDIRNVQFTFYYN
jgi:hypothetical protein